MKYITNKSIWNKIVIILVFIILFEFTFTSPVQATEATVLLSPIVNLFVSLGDGVMNLTQNILLQQIGDGGESLIKIQDNGGGIISKIIVALVFIVGTAVAVIGAIPSGGTSLALVAFAGKAIFAIAVSGYAYASTYSILENFVEGTIGTTYYLPMYEVTPYEIFADKVLLFDADFFDPKKNQNTQTSNKSNESIELDNIGERSTTWAASGTHHFDFDENQFKEFSKEYGFSDSVAQKVEGSEKQSMGVKQYTYQWTKDGKTYSATISDSSSGKREVSNMKLVSQADSKEIVSTAGELQSTVATWYLAFRNIALVALLSVLVYIGIRIMLCSVASDKAKYKQMLVDWTVAICLVFLMHYIMSFSVTISKKNNRSIFFSNNYN